MEGKSVQREIKVYVVFAFLAVFVAALRAQPAPCGISQVVSWKSAVYPPIAKAAYVSGVVVMLVRFERSGNASEIKVVSGPEMLRRPASDSVSTLKVNEFIGVRECPVIVTFDIGDCEKRGPYPKSELPQSHVCAESIVIYDPVDDPIPRRRRFLIFCELINEKALFSEA